MELYAAGYREGSDLFKMLSTIVAGIAVTSR